ncbi:DNA photolyase [Deferribacterales bacterium Es71-Z0220]|uniref:SPL family radical SAM protein n=1 Tax=Deferrivibrio essentukiensis TaxID=2880922 RepID=UPI001F6060D3|nr:DNA photolyase [Deferrivibrio essentukiensis]MCB4204221.1 DNA photolyase [Deferrivibrio essentukiensis]
MIYVEKKALNTKIVELLNNKNISYDIVESDAEFEDSKSNIFVTSSRGTFLRPCPATKIYRCCHYHVFDIMEGCPFDCSYCILQSYLNHEYIKIFADTNAIKDELSILDKKGRFRVGTGELSDSLALDNIFEFSKFFAPIVNNLENIQFEFKTKSANIGNLLNLNPKNIIVSFSLNTEYIASHEEHRAASINDRINAAKSLTEYGYKVAFHFDPIVIYPDAFQDYEKVISKLVNEIDERYVEFISLSTFRCIPSLIDKIREKFDRSILTKYSYISGLDGKFRYFKPERLEILNFVYKSIRKKWQNVFIYFCMEHATVWNKIIGYDPGEREEFERYFPWKR